MDYEPVIGLEVHIELKTKTKMFCDSLNDAEERHPNVNVCPVCLAHPGVLPVINLEAVKSVLKAGLALNCRIPETSKFDRKNYFYPDLPKGYQISQYDEPLCEEGFLEIVGIGSERQKIRIRRVHLEEDTGRLLHPEGADYSLVDFNRAGVPLMELVTEPDLRTGEGSRLFAEELQIILRYLGVSDAEMEKGQMRVEANISLRPEGSPDFGTKVEVKNLNSFKSVERAIDHEIKRQAEALGKGEKIVQETRGWNADKEKTFSQRSKEEAHDYRYFPEPDLPPLKIGEGELGLAKIRAGIPELPAGRRRRFEKEYFLPAADIEIFVVNKALGDYFEETISELKQEEKEAGHGGRERIHGPELTKTCANYLITDLQNLTKESGAEIKDILITPENFADFIKLIHLGEISSRAAKDILRAMFETGADPSQIMEEKNLKQISDAGDLENWVKEVIGENTASVEDYKKGKSQVLQFLIGKTMQKSKGRANPQIIGELLRKKLEMS